MLVPVLVEAARSTHRSSRWCWPPRHASEVNALSDALRAARCRRLALVSAGASSPARRSLSSGVGSPLPGRLLADAHRPLAPLLSDLSAAFGPLLSRAGRPGADIADLLDDPDRPRWARRRARTTTAPGAACRRPAELLERLINFVGEVLGSSSLRLEVGPTLVVLGVLLVLLQLVARPISRWQTTDAAGLAAIGRAMALAAEAGTDAVVVLGGAGIAALDRFPRALQTLAALPRARARGACGRPERRAPPRARQRSAGGRHRRGGPRYGPPSTADDRAPGAVAHRRRRGGPAGVERARHDRACAPGGRARPRQRARGGDPAARGSAKRRRLAERPAPRRRPRHRQRSSPAAASSRPELFHGRRRTSAPTRRSGPS